VPLKKRPALNIQSFTAGRRFTGKNYRDPWAKDGEVLRMNSQSRRRPSSVANNQLDTKFDSAGEQVIALRIDFVAKPCHKTNLACEVGRLFAEAGLHGEGLQASVLLVADREVRVVTLLTLWDGERFNPEREKLTAWTLKLISNFTDGSVRAFTNVAHFLLPQASTKLTLSDLRPAEIAELVAIVAAG